jgi:hypothetical protein
LLLKTCIVLKLNSHYSRLTLYEQNFHHPPDPRESHCNVGEDDCYCNVHCMNDSDEWGMFMPETNDENMKLYEKERKYDRNLNVSGVKKDWVYQWDMNSHIRLSCIENAKGISSWVYTHSGETFEKGDEDAPDHDHWVDNEDGTRT